MKKEVYRTRNSRKIYIPVYLMIIVLIVTIGYIKYSERELNFMVFQTAVAFSFIVVFMTEMHRLSNLYEINSNALTHVNGLLIKVTKRIDLLSVSDVDISQNPWQLVLGFGSVHAMIFSKEHSIDAKNINNPNDFVEFLEMKINEKRGTGGKGIH